MVLLQIFWEWNKAVWRPSPVFPAQWGLSIQTSQARNAGELANEPLSFARLSKLCRTGDM
jgi:hypothetical protein